MRRKALFLLALFCLCSSCASPTDEGERDLRFIDYSLSEVEGEALPGPASSLPGLVLWEGDDGSKLTVANGGVSCAADGTAEERYLFRLSRQGSEVWDPIRVSLDVTCEPAGSGTVNFTDGRTGEVLAGAIMERFDGCPVIQKPLPSMESLRAGYDAAGSGADFPAELELTGSLRGDFVKTECLFG
jgi:hypothetical protein